MKQGRMKAALLASERQFEIIEQDVPEVPIGHALIRVNAVAVCGSEIHAFFGEHPFRKAPVITGHEFSGTIVKLAPDVKGCKIGQRVTILPFYGCNTCEYCKEGKTHICSERVSLGTAKWPGPFGEYVLSHSDLILPVPDDIDFDAASLIEPVAVGVHAVSRVPLTKDSAVVILGAGMIGLAVLLALLEKGVSNIMVVDMFESRLLFAKKVGASITFNLSNGNLKDAVLKEFAGGAAVVFVAAGSDQAYVDAPALVERDGVVVVIGVNSHPCIIPSAVGGVGTERTILSSNAYVREDFSIAFKIAKNYDLRNFISVIEPIETIQNLFLKLTKSPQDFIRAVLHF